MSNYGKWFQNSNYESGYSSNSTGKRKRDEFTIGGGSSFGGGSSYGAGTGYSSSSGYGSGYGSTSGSGYSTGAQTGYGSGSSSYGGGTTGGYSSNRTSGYGGGAGATTASFGGANTSDNYDSFLSNQSLQMNEMSRKLRKMEMMQQIAELEMEGDDEEQQLRQRLENLQQQKRLRGSGGGGQGYDAGYGGGNYGGGYGGRRSLMDPPVGGFRGGNRVDAARRDRWGSGRMRQQRDNYGGGAGGQGTGGGRRDRKNRPGPAKKGGGRGGGGPTKTPPIKYSPRTTIKAIDTTGRDERLEKLMAKMKTFKDKNEDTATLHGCIKAARVNIDVFYYQKFGCLYLDGVVFGRGLAKPYKELAYKETIYKLKNLTLEKVYEQAKEMGKLAEMPTEKEYSKKPSEEYNILISPIEFSELPFEKRLELLAEEIKKCKHITVCLKVYCTKYMINMMSVYQYLEDEEVDKHEYKIYANSVYLTTAKGRLRKRVEFEAMKKVSELFTTKTVPEILENDGRFEKDYPDAYPQFVGYRGCGSQQESNGLQLKFINKVEDLESLKDKPIDDIILIEKNLWRGSKFRMLEESASYSNLLIKWVWEVEDPAVWEKEDETNKEATTEKKEGEEVKEEVKATDETKVKEDTKAKEEKTDNGTDNKDKKKGGYEAFDPAAKRREVVDQAKRKKCNIINCNVFLQDKQIGYGFGTTRNQATRMASACAIRQLGTSQTMLYHTDQDPSSFNKVYKFMELRARAENLKLKMPEAPVFESIENEQLFDRDEVMDDNAEEDMVTDINVKDEETPEKKDELEDELSPWVKEVVRQDMEELMNVDALIEGALTYLETPLFIRDLAGHYCTKYNLAHKSRFQMKRLMALNIQKQAPGLKEAVERLLKEPGKKAYGYTLQQIRKEDGTVEVLNKMNINRKQKRRHFDRK